MKVIIKARKVNTKEKEYYEEIDRYCCDFQKKSGACFLSTLNCMQGAYDLDMTLEIRKKDYNYCPNCGEEIEVEVFDNTIKEKFIPKIGECYFVWSDAYKKVYEIEYQDVDLEKSYIGKNNCFKTEEEAKERGRILELKEQYEYKPSLTDFQVGLSEEITTTFLIYNRYFKCLQWKNLDSLKEEFGYNNVWYPIEIINFKNRYSYIDFTADIEPEKYAYYILGLC